MIRLHGFFRCFWMTAILILCFGLSETSIVADEISSRAPGLQVTPTGWSIVREIEVPAPQLAQFSTRLQVPLVHLFNTFVRFESQELQINTLVAKTVDDATNLKEILRKGKSNARWVVQNDVRVYEFVVRQTDQALLACRARYDFDIQPKVMKYHVEFDAIPIQKEKPTAGPDDRNRLFNLLLQFPLNAKLEPEIIKLSQQFETGSEVELIGNLQRGIVAAWMSPESAHAVSSSAETVRLSLKTSRRIAEIPVAHFACDLAIDMSIARTVDSSLDQKTALAKTTRFPVDAPEIQNLVSSIVQPADSDPLKLQKLLAWFTKTQNIRYDGLTGSRYGTLLVAKQRFGRCWDYSDLFITIARGSGLPCRQVFGWLHESEGHVWCDVLVDGQWRMVDPTTGTVCGSDYLPFCISTDGEFPLLYASKVTIQNR